ncbi:glycosyltransferase family 2 protein [Robertkochia aurantiaca]|uniref:glycosyltransferase family 2 protein n=1 Tax=Robertkochia aurantiaca TaxID=2873700 RepID=UPI001CCF7BFA|nr:glycosyltransferase family 2 protein [Robertkochia sp. 3YJGBD-33]
MKIAIVILNWNGKELLEKFLPSVVNHSKEATVWVADNASSDDSVAFVRENYPEVKLVQNSVNGGYAKGYNDALQHIEADLFCLLNSDVEVTQGWLTPIIEAFEKDQHLAVAQPKILDYKNPEFFEYAGAAGGFIDRLGYPFCRGRIFQSLEKDNGQYNDHFGIFWASGACMFVRKEVFVSNGGFDEDYFAHQEEIDFCWKTINRGYQIRYIGSSVVYHVGGATLNAMNPQKTFLNFRNSLFSITKNLPRRKVLPLLIARLLLDGIAAARFLFQLKVRHFAAVFKAHLSFYRNLGKMLKKRDFVNKDIKYYKCTSIVLSYFVYRRKLYKQVVSSDPRSPQ